MAKKRKKKRSRKSRKKSRKAKRPKKTRKVKKSRKRTRKTKRSRRKSRKVKRSPKRQVLKSPTYSKDSDGNPLIKVSDSWANHAYANESTYKKKYKLSIKENEKFWAKEGKRISWIKKYSSSGEIVIRAKYKKDLTIIVKLINSKIKKILNNQP